MLRVRSRVSGGLWHVCRSYGQGKVVPPSFFEKHRALIVYGGTIVGLLAALQLDVHRNIRFASTSFVESLAKSESSFLRNVGTYSLYRLSRDYQHSILLGQRGTLEKLGQLLDEKLASGEPIDDATRYIYACLNNMSRYPAHKLQLVTQPWIRRYRETVALINENEDETTVEPMLITFSCFLSSLSTYSRNETAIALAYGGATEWIKIGLTKPTESSMSSLPRSVRLLLKDQRAQPFSSPIQLIGVPSSFSMSSTGTQVPSGDLEHFVLAFSLITVAELSRHVYAREILVKEGITTELLKQSKTIISNEDVVNFSLLVRALAFVSKSGTVKKDMVENKEWKDVMEEILDNTAGNLELGLFTGIWFSVLFQDAECAKAILASSLNKTQIISLVRQAGALPDYSRPPTPPLSFPPGIKNTKTPESNKE